MQVAQQSPGCLEFGRFRVLLRRRQLLAGGAPIELGSRAFDVLMVLLEARGSLVTKDQLLDRVWPGIVVEENNIQVQISTLRKALGEDRNVILTVPLRGYRFTGEVRARDCDASAATDIITPDPDRPAVTDLPVADDRAPDGRAVRGAAAAAAPPRAVTNLPEPVSELIGREAEIDEILRLATAHRLVTLTGPGGIGKTRLALAVARLLLPKFANGAWLAELASLSDPDVVPTTVAVAPGLHLPAGAVSAERIANALGSQHLLLVLDNCEHVINAAAGVAEALLRTNAGLHVIATSREPLGAEGEIIYRVPPLGVPAAGTEDIDDVLNYGAARLFVARARAAQRHFRADRSVSAATTAICRHLDGIPLAIELAAARVATLGIEEVAARLDDRFRLLTSGRRTALPRHQTLRATLDWSYDLLSPCESLILRRLSIFAGSFTLEAASMVAAGADITGSSVVDCVVNLVTKSLVVADVDGPEPRYRLLETTRAYALEKLTDSGERDEIARRHAEYYRHLLHRAAVESVKRPAAEWLAAYGPDIDNVRAALDWAYSPGGDPSVGVALTIASVPLWLHAHRAKHNSGQGDAKSESEPFEGKTKGGRGLHLVSARRVG
jgi:predicted ATPase/DNA-binding winged helix-turn-helix (wHTH) protein